MTLEQRLLHSWQQRRGLALWLWPLAQLFGLISLLRRLAYRLGWLRSQRLPVPLIIIGNLIAGGSGKTPLTLHLATALTALGRRPGIISRGHGGTLSRRGQCAEVHHDSPASAVGDEPLLIKRRSGCPVFVGRDRVAAAQALLAAHPACDLILSDDGLQHYRLARDLELVVMDGRGLMNGWLLPAGPLREPPSRLSSVTALVLNGHATPPQNTAHLPCFGMQLEAGSLYRLDRPAQLADIAALRHQKLAAVAGIAVPQRFFDQLSALGLEFSRHAFADHHAYTAAELAAIEAEAIVMTEKDAVKCGALDPALLAQRPIWVLPVSATVHALSPAHACHAAPSPLATFILQQLATLESSRGSTSA